MPFVIRIIRYLGWLITCLQSSRPIHNLLIGKKFNKSINSINSLLYYLFFLNFKN